MSKHGGPEDIQDLLNRSKYEEQGNPSLNIDHVRYQLKNWEGHAHFPSYERFHEVNPSSEDIHTAINAGWFEPVLHHGAKNFGHDHTKRVLEIDTGHFARAAARKSPLDSEGQKLFFDGENPKFKIPSVSLGLAENPNLSKEHFDKIWDHSFSHDSKTKFAHGVAPSRIRYALMLNHKKKLSPEQAKQLYDHGVTGIESTALRDHLTQEQWDTLRVK